MSFAKLRSVPDPLAGLKADLDTARQHHARLEARLTAAHGEAGSASAAQRALLTNPTSEPGDVELGEAAARVGRANVAIDGIVGALDETRGRIEAIEAGISAEREATERAAEAARLDRAISAARATIAETAGAIEEFAQTFSLAIFRPPITYPQKPDKLNLEAVFPI